VIIPLASPAARDHASAGGKARTLARLLAAGFPVPDGFVVTAPEDAHAGELAERLTALEARGGPGARFAVRSSGQAEDSAAASFAGQFETVLGVRGSGTSPARSSAASHRLPAAARMPTSAPLACARRAARSSSSSSSRRRPLASRSRSIR